MSDELKVVLLHVESAEDEINSSAESESTCDILPSVSVSPNFSLFQEPTAQSLFKFKEIDENNDCTEEHHCQSTKWLKPDNEQNPDQFSPSKASKETSELEKLVISELSTDLLQPPKKSVKVKLEDYHTFPILKKETRQLDFWNNGELKPLLGTMICQGERSFTEDSISQSDTEILEELDEIFQNNETLSSDECFDFEHCVENYLKSQISPPSAELLLSETSTAADLANNDIPQTTQSVEVPDINRDVPEPKRCSKMVTFLDSLRKPFLNLNPKHEGYHTFPIHKKPTRQLGSWVNGQFVQKVEIKPNDSTHDQTKTSMKIERPLENYIKAQTAAILNEKEANLEQTKKTKAEEEMVADFPLMLQGLDANWPKPKHNTDVDVIFSVNKSALTVDLDLSPYEATAASWNEEENHEEEQHGKQAMSKADIIASFVIGQEEIQNLPSLESTQGTRMMEEGTSENDDLILPLLQQLKSINQILMDSVIVNREALDMLTFPLSHDFEPLSRVRGMLWTLSQAARMIKWIDKQGTVDTDTDTMINYIAKEVKQFAPLVQQFMSESLTLVSEIQTELKKVRKILVEIEKVSRKLFSFSSFSHNSSISIYSSELDPSTVTYYEQYQGSNFFDYNKTSIELLWTPTLSYFKGFTENDWFCFQVEAPHTQVKILLAVIKLARKIFLDVKYILGEEHETLENHLAPSIQEIHKELKTLKNKSNLGGTVSLKLTSLLDTQIQALFDLYNTMENYMNEFEVGFKWIDSVIDDVSQMAGLRREDMDEFLEQHDPSIGTYNYCSIFSSCKQKLHPFLQNNFKFILIRVPLPNDLIFKLIEGLLDKATWSTNVNRILKIMTEAQISQFREKEAQENRNETSKTSVNYSKNKSSGGIEQVNNSEEIRKTPLTVYNVGHVFVTKK